MRKAVAGSEVAIHEVSRWDSSEANRIGGRLPCPNRSSCLPRRRPSRRPRHRGSPCSPISRRSPTCASASRSSSPRRGGKAGQSHGRHHTADHRAGPVMNFSLSADLHRVSAGPFLDADDGWIVGQIAIGAVPDIGSYNWLDGNDLVDRLGTGAWALAVEGNGRTGTRAVRHDTSRCLLVASRSRWPAVGQS